MRLGWLARAAFVFVEELLPKNFCHGFSRIDADQSFACRFLSFTALVFC
jgi:hypothetical protein